MANVLDHENIASTVIDSIQNLFEQKQGLEFSQAPEHRECTMIDYNKRMRSLSLEKFNGPCYTSYINYYTSSSNQDDKDVVGALVCYVEESVSERLLGRMGYKCSIENEDLMLDSVGEFCNLIAEHFKNNLVSKGFFDLSLSTPKTKVNEIMDGIPFHLSQYSYHEVVFYLFRQKSLVISVTMGPIPRK